MKNDGGTESRTEGKNMSLNFEEENQSLQFLESLDYRGPDAKKDITNNSKNSTLEGVSYNLVLLERLQTYCYVQGKL